jgi:hypothetical protein
MKRDIHEVIEEFLLDRFKEYESPDLTDEWFTDTFIPNLSNINDYYNSTDCFSSVVGFISAVKFVDKYHIDNFGESFLKFQDLSRDYILLNYTEVYVRDLGLQGFLQHVVGISPEVTAPVVQPLTKNQKKKAQKKRSKERKAQEEIRRIKKDDSDSDSCEAPKKVVKKSSSKNNTLKK